MDNSTQIGDIALALLLLGTSPVYAVDSDGDGLQDAMDNCTLVANMAQRDT